MDTIDKMIILRRQPTLRVGYVLNIPIKLKYSLHGDFLVGHNHKLLSESTIFDILVKDDIDNDKSFSGANLTYPLWNGGELKTEGIWWQSNVAGLKTVFETEDIDKRLVYVELIGNDTRADSAYTFISRFVDRAWWTDQKANAYYRNDLKPIDYNTYCNYIKGRYDDVKDTFTLVDNKMYLDILNGVSHVDQ